MGRYLAATRFVSFTILQIDPAYKMAPEKDKSPTDSVLYTLHQGIAISDRPLDEDEEDIIKQAELLEKLEWMRSLEGR